MAPETAPLTTACTTAFIKSMLKYPTAFKTFLFFIRSVSASAPDLMHLAGSLPTSESTAKEKKHINIFFFKLAEKYFVKTILLFYFFLQQTGSGTAYFCKGCLKREARREFFFFFLKNQPK